MQHKNISDNIAALIFAGERRMKTLDIDECAEFLKVDRTTALALAGKGDLPGAKIGRAWVFLEDDLVEYLRGRVRAQQRQRQIEADVQKGLDAAAAREATFSPPAAPARAGRKKRALPNLDALPHLGGQIAGSQVAVTP